MIGLNKIFKSFDKLRYRLWELIPDNKIEINIFINSIQQMFENLVYLKMRGNTKRYSNMKGDVPVESILSWLSKNLKNLDKINLKQLDNSLSEFDSKLDHIQWDIKSAKKSLGKILSQLDKN